MIIDDNEIVVFIIVGLILIVGPMIYRSEKAHREQKKLVNDGRNRLIEQPIPADISRDIARAKSGDWGGEERSPLTYLGYRVGKTNGLRSSARLRRLKVCFAMEMPDALPAKYQNWGRPVTYIRYASIHNHLLMLADQRRGRASLEFAVSEWDSDLQWLKEEYGQAAEDLKKFSYIR